MAKPTRGGVRLSIEEGELLLRMIATGARAVRERDRLRERRAHATALGIPVVVDDACDPGVLELRGPNGDLVAEIDLGDA